MKRRTIWISLLLVLVVVSVLAYFLLTRQNAETIETAGTNPASLTKEELPKLTKQAKEGRYAEYTEAKRSDARYAKTVLFFHAPWCVECRGYEKSINDSELPSGTQILKVDYDSSRDLRKQYGVTIQSTFVRVMNDGTKVKLWNGYGKDKSVEAILSNT